MIDQAYPTAIPYTFTRADVEGTERRITLLGSGYYRIDDSQESQSSIAGDGDTLKLASSDSDPFAMIAFPNPSGWTPENLGYENLWMLISYYPLERTPGVSGYSCRSDAGLRYVQSAHG